jgi:dipeptidyl aminopeptidase/acylaminoacyl peptidase
MLRKIIAVVAFGICCTTVTAKPITLEDYTRHEQFIDVKISPSGKYLAISRRADDGNVEVVVLQRKDFAVQSQHHFRGKDSINQFFWANDERLIFTLAREVGALETPQLTGELYAINADGKKGLMLTGYRSKEAEATASEIIHFLPDDDNSVLISSRNLRKREPMIEFYKLNIQTGRKNRVGQAPIQSVRGGQIYAITDNTGTPRLVLGTDPAKDTDTILMYRPDNSETWQELGRYNEQNERTFLPLAFSADNKSVYGLSDLNSNTKAIALLDLASKQQEVLAEHPLTDLTPVMSIVDGRNADIIGARYEYDNIDTIFFDNANESSFGKSLQGLIAAFPGKQVDITSTTEDNKLAIVKVSSANQDNMYYLFELTTNKLAYLLNSRPWLKDAEMPQTKLVQYKARDGQNIMGLLTLPKEGEAKNLPLVVFPHGGPIGPRDSISSFNAYMAYMKMLAEHGYAVLQPNYRGSGGYGLSFQQAGYQKWGTMMIDDMTDGVRDLAKQGIVDPNRVCTFGASYGGYAAIQTAIREPDLYKCSIAYVGVFDLNSLYEVGDIPETQMGVRFLERTLGKDKTLLDAQSPLKNLDKLKAPVFIVHGEEDTRTPIAHANMLRTALEKQNHPFEWLVKPKEGHGFYKPENNIELMQKALKFLDKHIGAAQ